MNSNERKAKARFSDLGLRRDHTVANYVMHTARAVTKALTGRKLPLRSTVWHGYQNSLCIRLVLYLDYMVC